mmetsp:Transcript_33247/g.103190  ORF Transcript_33247/g.103190 Transcript_33247/m.103190 type:complete len:220 (-) Transcript_33247:70-729(-)
MRALGGPGLIPPALACAIAGARALSPCPGETRGSHLCNFNDKDGFEFRVCQRVVGPGGAPLAVAGGKSWWVLSDQVDREGTMTKRVRAANGSSWCTCALCTSEVIAKVGCGSIPIQCNATDVAWVLSSTDVKLKALQGCLSSQCTAPTQQLSDAGLGGPVSSVSRPAVLRPAVAAPPPALAATALLAAGALGLLARRRASGRGTRGLYSGEVPSCDELS